MCRVRSDETKADVSWEETGICTRRTTGVWVQASGERFAEMTLGRANSQQGLATTCKDSLIKSKTETMRGFWSGARASRSDEGRVMPAEAGIDAAPEEVTPSTGKGALGKWRAPDRNTLWTQCQTNGDNLNGCRAGGITRHPRGVCRRVLKPRDEWEGPSGKAAAANRTREIRPSGMRGGLTET